MTDKDLLSDERQFIENLLNARANFGLVVFGLAIAAAVAAENRWLQAGILAIAFGLCAILAAATGRSQWKLDLIIADLPDTHPAKAIDERAKAEAPKLSWLKRQVVGKSRRRWLGYGIPWMTSGLLFLGAVLAATGLFEKDPGEARLLRRHVDSLTLEVHRGAIDYTTMKGRLERLEDSVAVMSRRVSHAVTADSVARAHGQPRAKD